ncbi:uncharacterized protein DNG_01483 [Cephalotrichum gorgonifer]|uniref:MARVEL domain-containing protein n=1 Tax=Cephalotrichum gorgonifer TaxID=2041049 RepID=A0AAE8MRS7_9PEZI|nr:uncharacterized protein DNG_01483 [Cephalotrichum gorgonifer]
MDPQYQQQQPAPVQQQVPQQQHVNAVQQPAAPAVAVSRGPFFQNLTIAPPTWVLAIRGVQVVVSIVIVGLAGYLIHGAYADPQGFAIACSVLTWVGVSYILLSEKLASLRSLYNVFAVLAVDFFFVILWLSAMGTNAAHRAAFVIPYQVTGCSDDGSLIDSTVCWKVRKRAFIAGKVGLGTMTGLAIACALEFVLFAVVFGWTIAAYLKARKSAAPALVSDGGEKQNSQPPQPQFQQPAPASYQQQAGAIPLQPTPPYQPQQQQQWAPVQPQYTGGSLVSAPTPPPQPQYYPQQQPGVAPTYAQELPGQYAGGASAPPQELPGPHSGAASPPPQGYGRPTQ